MQISALDIEKKAARQRARALRAGLRPEWGDAAAGHVLASLDIAPGLAVAGTWPVRGEMDLRPLWHALHARGARVLLPETPPPGEKLIFRRWSPECHMVPERFGTERPKGPIDTPELIFVPFLAFDQQGHRLGYGGGYFDRTLAAHPGVPAIGLGFAALEVDCVPVGPHDRALDAVFTEQGLAVDRRG